MDSLASKGDLQKKLKFLSLNLEKIPEEILDFKPLNFNVTRLSNDKDHKVFRYVPVDNIQILLTPCLRSDPLKEKYAKAMPLYKYILPAEKEEDIDKYTTFLRMLDKVTVSEIENIASIQKEFDKKEPFKVKYNKDHLWQIYYSENTGSFFMLVCTKEETFAEFFYLLKLKLEGMKKNSKALKSIYVPINAVNFTEEFLSKTEIADLENYLWLFTKNWALTFEVYSKAGNLSLQIIGDTIVYDKVKSTYKIKIRNRDEALKFYKLMKALFILQTEIKDRYKFTTRIDSNNGLELYYNQTRLSFDMLADFIKNEVENSNLDIRMLKEKNEQLEVELLGVKEAVKLKEDEYLVKQKEISTFLEYKKTFFGKVKYYFKSTKINRKIKEQQEVESSLMQEKQKENVKQEENKTENQEINDSILSALKGKKYFTIEDLVSINSLFEKYDKANKDLNQDLKAQRLRLENIISKVKNATAYIEEIDKHRKSIFEFWKYSNKDEKFLEEGNQSGLDNNGKALKKSFDIESDFEQLGEKVDSLQRKKLTKEEMDAIFLANSEVLPILNMLRENKLDEDIIEETLEELKDGFNDSKYYTESESFDIFGNMTDDSTKVKYIGAKSHRENEKSKYQILNINKKIDLFDFTEKLQSVNTCLEGVIPKMTSEYDFSLYKVCQITDGIDERSFDVFNLDPEKALEEFKDDGEGALNLIKLNYKEGMPILYYSNIILYDNNNETLPVGMDLSKNVFIDLNRLNFTLVKQDKFRTNNYFTESNNLLLPKTKDVFVYEYDVELKIKK